jgi:uncharacterized protein involved in outer membrane biogenesis
MNTTRFRLALARPGARIAVALALALAALVVSFDWNWFRAPLVRYLTHTSGREVRIDDLDVDLGASLVPTVRLRGLYVENAPWAARQPLVTAEEVSFTVSLKSLWQRRPVITRMTLVDADIDMERQADGLRNWRLRDPEDRSAGKVKVLTLEARRTRLRWVNRALDLEFVVTTSDPALADRSNDALTTRVAFEGVYQGASFTGEALSGAVMSFRESGTRFPLRGHIVSRGTRLDVDGFFTDLFDIGPIDAQVRLSGPSLALLHPFVRVRPKPSRPYSAEAQLKQTAQVFDFSQLKATIGKTGLTGSVVYDRSADRPMLRASVHSAAADFEDVRPLLGMNASKTGAGERGNGEDDRGGVSAGKLFPSTTLHTAALGAIDVRVTASARLFTAPAWPVMHDFRMQAQLERGVLEVKRIEAAVAGGRLAATLALDARQPIASAVVSAQLDGIRLETLVPSLSAKAGAAGGVSARIDLQGRGDSIAAIVGRSRGSLTASMARGRISNLADAKLGFDIGKVVAIFLRGDSAIAINCGAIAFDVNDGIAKARSLTVDTEHTHVEGTGSIDLARELVNIRIVPEPKKPGLFTRRAAIRIGGALRGPAMSIEDRDRGDAQATASSSARASCPALAQR